VLRLIVKMRFISLMGKTSDLDRVAREYIKAYDIHLENSISRLHDMKGIMPFTESNPHDERLKQIKEIVNCANIDEKNTQKRVDLTIPEADEIIKKVSSFIKEKNEEKERLQLEKKNLESLVHQMDLLKGVDMPIEKLLSFQFIKFRFGKMPKDSFRKLEDYIKDNMDAVFLPSSMDQHFVWGIYLMPQSIEEKVDAIFTSLNFERAWIPDGISGTPLDVQKEKLLRIKEIEKLLEENSRAVEKFYEENKIAILSAHDVIEREHKIFDIRKYAAHTKDDFYIISGWMTQRDLKSLIKKLDKDENVIYTLDENDPQRCTPPTKIKNFFLFKPFEMFVKMYGLPSYNEIDPTPFLAITYSTLFGMMFGDLGQGFLLFAGGLLFYKFKKSSLGAILSLCGAVSMIFGVMYGSVFGFEGYPIHHVWLSPMEKTGTMTILLTTIGIGALIILFTMLFNIINAIKSKRVAKCLFDTNGIAGFLFYATVVYAFAPFVCSMFGKELAIPAPNGKIVAIILSVCLILVFLREPLERVIDKREKPFPHGIGGFFLESFFELFEILLSFITNSISFVRVGGFALSHAGMMAVVHMLAKSSTENPSVITLILGNLFVMGLEGLIVGIQVLRLEYYEMFSRFYEGRGKQFTPYKIK